MTTSKITQGIILGLLIVFVGLFSSLKLFSSMYAVNSVNTYAHNTYHNSYAYPSYSYNKQSYYSQYNYNYNNYNNHILGRHPYIPVNAYRGSGAANYVGRYGNQGWYGPFLFPSVGTKCGSSKCNTPTYNSHTYINNPLDYVYFTNPGLLAPRTMNNNQRWLAGVWPQAYAY